MPILKEEQSIYPDDLLEETTSLDTDRQWWVLHTKARQEKSVSRNLLSLEIPFYLPLIRKTSTRGGRKFHSRIPLFPGYVFMYGSEDERFRSLATNRIVRTLTVEDAEEFVHDLCQLRQLIEAEAPLTVESRLVPGNKVRVLSGSFAGVEGTVLDRRGQMRLLVAISFLQQGASVEIEDHLLEPI
jgi:transcription antitermination factor NusG